MLNQFNGYRDILAGLFRTGSALILSMGTAFVLTLMYAYYFGTTSEMAAFLMASIIPGFLSNAMTSGYQRSFIPVYVEQLCNKGKIEAQNLVGNISALSLLQFLVLIFLLSVIGRPFMEITCEKFSSESQQLSLSLFYFLIPVVLLNGWAIFCGCLLISEKVFGISEVASGLKNICVMLTLYFGYHAIGIYAVPLGMIIGGILQVISTVLILKKMSVKTTPIWHGFDDQTVQLTRGYLSIFAVALISSSSGLIDRTFAASIGEEHIAILNYGQTVAVPLQFFLATALGTVSYPYFSALIAEKDITAISKSIHAFVFSILTICTPLCAAVWFYSDEIISLFFEHGRFSSDQTKAVSSIQRVTVLLTPFYVSFVLGARILSGANLNHVLNRVILVQFGVKIALTIILTDILGLIGIPYATLLSTSVGVMVIFFYIYQWSKINGTCKL